MNTKEKIEAVLSLYKTAINSYRWENHYWNHKPFEQGFNRRLMTDTTSSLYDDVCSLFIELTLPQAHRYISMWETRYIISGWCADEDQASYNRLQAIGQTFINECKRIAQEVCKPEGEQPQKQPQGGRGIDHPTKVQQKKAQTQIYNWGADNPKSLLIKAANLGLIEPEGNSYRWIRTAALYGYFVDRVSDHLNIRLGNGRISWQKFGGIINNHDTLLTSAKQAVNDYRNKGISPPEGDDIVNSLIKSFE